MSTTSVTAEEWHDAVERGDAALGWNGERLMRRAGWQTPWFAVVVFAKEQGS